MLATNICDMTWPALFLLDRQHLVSLWFVNCHQWAGRDEMEPQSASMFLIEHVINRKKMGVCVEGCSATTNLQQF